MNSRNESGAPALQEPLLDASLRKALHLAVSPP